MWVSIVKRFVISRLRSPKRFLLSEWKQAKKGVVTPNCREKCSGCGAAKFGGGVCFERGK